MDRMIGGILLIVGTSIGGGMLALPVVTAQAGFIPALLIMLLTWAIMTACAFWLLEVNLWLPEGSNLISMAKATLGPIGQMISWVAYLLLLYCLLSAYIAGGGDVVQHLLQNIAFPPNEVASDLIFVVVLGAIVVTGIRLVDWVNRGLLFAKLVAFVLIIFFALPHVHVDYLTRIDFSKLNIAVLTVITSFGYAIIVPNLRCYFKGDVARLRKVIAIGSLFPLVCYFIWELSVLGAVALHGQYGLKNMVTSGHATSDLMMAIEMVSGSSIVHVVVKLFTTLCVGTSFLGVSLAMMHFLHDGLRTSHSFVGKSMTTLAAFVPPLVMVLFYPNAFIAGLNYAGICCVILLMLLPAAMAYSGRYVKHIHSGYQTWGGKGLLIAVMLLSFGYFGFVV